MFRKLKIELILINLILTSILLLTIFSGIYVLMKSSFDHSAYMMMDKTLQMEHIKEGERGQKGPNPMVFIIKTDNKKNIIYIESNFKLTDNEFKTLKDRALKSDLKRGSITYNNLNLRYVRIHKDYGFAIVFQDKSFDNGALNSLIKISIIVCIVSLIVVFIISLLLSNIALKPIINVWEKQKAFVADASHELRTPLSVIRTNLDLVLDNHEETVGSQEKWLNNIKTETQRMTKLIEDLLFLARSDSGKKSLMRLKFDLSSVIIRSVTAFEPIAIQNSIKLKYNVLNGIRFNGNEGRINQLMVILIDNAIKHTPEGGTIKVNMNIVKNKINIIVSDTGEGIEEEYLDKIFERFYKVDKSRAKREGEGHFGLGLSIAKTIVDELNGDISVSSKPNEGATFKVVFKLA
ncbi:sensor histidine kinase [Clostridium fermenticellae]|uniref:histidine kinase n=1 Tax=Clostridium fermenticellae TaxID=2068654 RepID=A0A386H454_9CLOT|nr:HAMP domain-containing sensor histidine kinase [Clostridium fermenticellae]AYD40460.1 sensor histidine kinase [Clostridium fermenticellae]